MMFQKPEWMSDREWKREKRRLAVKTAQTMVSFVALAMSLVALLYK